MLRILHIENDAMIQRAFGRAFARNGFDVDTAASGEVAVEMLAKGDYDAVVSDFNLDGKMTGGDVLRWLREVMPAMVKRFIIVSGNHAVEDLGHENLLMKPCQIQDLVNKINQVAGAAT